MLCPECGGTGELEYDTDDDYGLHIEECEFCDGSGRLDDEDE